MLRKLLGMGFMRVLETHVKRIPWNKSQRLVPLENYFSSTLGVEPK